MEGIKVQDQKPPVPPAMGEAVLSKTTLSEEELIRIEFYKTYDVMTGIRIAATLGGFFSMMILLVLYKSYCKPSKSLSEEKLTAAVSAAVEEEDRALAAALEATSFYSSLRKTRQQSVGSNSAPSSQPRFSNSTSGQMMRYPSEEEFCQHEYEGEDILPDQDQLPDYYAYSYLSVPVDRRASSATCSSGDTSYLEKRGSAFEVGHPLPPVCCHRSEKRRLPASDEPWDFYYPIDIQVIQPTPQLSPCGSEQTLYDDPSDIRRKHGLKVPALDRIHRLSVDRSEIGLAPLASISSLGSFSSTVSSPFLGGPHRKIIKEEEYKEDSVGSDSVFVNDVDTEDEVDEFETDSEMEDGFDDDYSFCEASRRPISRCDRQPRFASFDSCDTSIAAESDIAVDEPQHHPSRNSGSRSVSRQHSAHDGVKVKKRLTKTNSEPRHTKQLPAWVERGRSGYVPRRQWSAPSRQKTESQEVIVPESSKAYEPSTVISISERPQMPIPCSESSSDSPTLTQFEGGHKQGIHKEMPSIVKRGHFQKQRTLGGLGTGLLAPPPVAISGSCERLNDEVFSGGSGIILKVEVNPPPKEEETSISYNQDSSGSNTSDTLRRAEDVEINLPSRTSSQETLC